MSSLLCRQGESSAVRSRALSCETPARRQVDTITIRLRRGTIIAKQSCSRDTRGFIT
jgi:hypothetical protein